LGGAVARIVARRIIIQKRGVEELFVENMGGDIGGMGGGEVGISLRDGAGGFDEVFEDWSLLVDA
jgi:hypothetical protein